MSDISGLEENDTLQDYYDNHNARLPIGPILREIEDSKPFDMNMIANESKQQKGQIMTISIIDLSRLQKFCDNKLTYDEFLRFKSIENDSYSAEQFTLFKHNPVQYITNKKDELLLSGILTEIVKTGYKG